MPNSHDRRSAIIGLNINTAPPLDTLICPHKRRRPTSQRDSRAPWRLITRPNGIDLWPPFLPPPSATAHTVPQADPSAADATLAIAGELGSGKWLRLSLLTDERR